MELLPAIFLFAFSSTVTPGPNNIMIMTSGLNFGVRRSVPHLLGICIGFPVMVILVGVGLGFVFAQYPLIHEMIKIVGIIYLFYLAWRIANASAGDMQTSRSRPLSFWQAALFQWLNPKGWIMATSAIAAYTSVDGDIYFQVSLISLAFFLVAFPCVALWLFFGISLKKILTSERQLRLFNRSMATLLVLSISPVIYDLVLGAMA